MVVEEGLMGNVLIFVYIKFSLDSTALRVLLHIPLSSVAPDITTVARSSQTIRREGLKGWGLICCDVPSLSVTL